MSKLGEEHPSWEGLRIRVAAATGDRPGIPNPGNQCYVCALLQCLFALPLSDNFDTQAGRTQDLLRLLNHPSIIVRQALTEIVKARLPALGMDQAAQQDVTEFLQILMQTVSQGDSTERKLLDVICFQYLVKISKCHCGMEHEERADVKYIIDLPMKTCQCKASASCKCPVTVENAFDALNTTEHVTDVFCNHNGKKGSADRKYSCKISRSPEVVFLAQGRVNKSCECADQGKCSHRVNPFLTFIFPFAVAVNTLFTRNSSKIRTHSQVRKLYRPLQMPSTVDIFRNGCLYVLWGWVGHIGTTAGSGHLYSVTRTNNGTEESPEFLVHDDKDCTKLSEVRSSLKKVTKLLEGKDAGYESSQAVLAVYVRQDVAEQV